MAQCAQFPQQDALPFYFPFLRLRMITTTTATSPRLMRIVPRFSENHASIVSSPFRYFAATVSFSASLYFLKKSI